MPEKYELFLDKNKKVKLSANEQGDLFAEANGKAIKLGADGLQAIAEDGSLEAIGGGGGGLEGDTFVYVSGAGTPAENGQELVDAIETAKTAKRKETIEPFYFLSGYAYNFVMYNPSIPLVELYVDEFDAGTAPYELGINAGDEFEVTALELFTNTTVTMTWRILQSDDYFFQAEVVPFGMSGNSGAFDTFTVSTPLQAIVPGTVVVAPGNYDITNATGTQEVLATSYNKENEVRQVIDLDASYINVVSLTGSRDVNITGSLLISERNIFLKGLVLEGRAGIIMSDNGLADITGENLKVGSEAMSSLSTEYGQNFEGKFKFSNCDFGSDFFPRSEYAFLWESFLLTGECNNCTFGDRFIHVFDAESGGNITLDLLNCNFGNEAIHFGADLASPTNLTLNAKNCNFGNGCIYWNTNPGAACILNIDSCVGNKEFIRFTNNTITGRIVNTKAIVSNDLYNQYSFRAFEAAGYYSIVFDNCHSEMSESFGYPFVAQNYTLTYFLRCSTAGEFWAIDHPVIGFGSNSIRFCLKNLQTSPYTNFPGTTEEIPTL